MPDGQQFETYIANIDEAIRVIERVPAKHLNRSVVRRDRISGAQLTEMPIAIAFDGHFMERGFSLAWHGRCGDYSRGFYTPIHSDAVETCGPPDFTWLNRMFGDAAIEYIFAARMEGVLDNMLPMKIRDDKELTLFRLHTRRAEFSMSLKMQKKLALATTTVQTHASNLRVLLEA